MIMHLERPVSFPGTLSELSLGLLVTGSVLGDEVSDDIDGFRCRRVWKRMNRQSCFRQGYVASEGGRHTKWGWNK